MGGMTMFRLILATLTTFVFGAFAMPPQAFASRCIAYVDKTPGVTLASFSSVKSTGDVKITFVGHSTFRVRTPRGIVIATDYAGFAGEGPIPTVATMNHAHETHYTPFPDPLIKHVMRGWNPNGGPAKHRLKVDDVLIRNVPTDIRSWAGSIEKDGNSIFIFEVADLCIGHLGHLHHKPTPEQFAKIGRLDVVFAPVDGSMTLDLPTMIEVLKELKASLVIPMHYFAGTTLDVFLAGMSKEFAIKRQDSPTTVVSLQTLPRKPTVLVMPGGYH